MDLGRNGDGPTAWSPEQIAPRLRLDFPNDETMRISHESIYQSLYVQGRGALRRDLTAFFAPGGHCACLGRPRVAGARPSSLARI